MSRFLLHIIIFVSLFFVATFLIALNADGYSDPFYLKFTTPKKSSLILGNSKAAQGIKPQIFNEQLNQNIYNYSFAINSSPFGPKYLKSIKKKLDKKETSGLFIISVDPWSIASTCDNPNDTISFRENDTYVDKIKYVDKKPNFQYFFNYMYGHLYKIIHKPKTAFLHNDGWLEVSLSLDSLQIARRTQSTLKNYENHVLNYQYSDLRWKYLLQTINLLSNYGELYIVRLPVSSKLMSMENKLMPNLNNKINSLNRIISGYINLTNKNHLFNYTDGVHLDKLSAEIATVMILDSIKTIQSNNKKE